MWVLRAPALLVLTRVPSVVPARYVTLVPFLGTLRSPDPAVSSTCGASGGRGRSCQATDGDVDTVGETLIPLPRDDEAVGETRTSLPRDVEAVCETRTELNTAASTSPRDVEAVVATGRYGDDLASYRSAIGPQWTCTIQL